MPGLNGGRPSAITVYPHFVQLNVPERGFGSELDAMVQFCLEHGEEFRIGCFREIDRRDCILFRFRDPKNAAEFARRFGGEIFAVPSDDDLFFP
ncbi:hypothetical protein IVB22_01440 [Bradyrhizobium sp. 190]|uniref:hypothetical protein n=1 Tax=Bradyrhizobium sp. 190 TaxID=2782658 RepID=UPI001FF73A55|nr:hypothetical protein [Bradyrhizobium sp. 190]MCK1511254.1 hypothetical protein [Bradyrhizobium sp. 190]